MLVTLIEVPYDSGRFGERMGAGPRHLLDRGLAAAIRASGHEVEVVALRLPSDFNPEVVSAVELMRQVSGAVAVARAAGRLPVVLSGNCSTGVGTVTGLGGGDTGVVWFDAHGDLNTPETTPSGFFDGTCFAMLLGFGWEAVCRTIPGFVPVPAGHAALLGARDLDPPEAGLIDNVELLELSVEALASDEGKQSLEALGRRVERLYVHVDLDVLDPEVLRANQFAADHGLTVDGLVDAIAVAARQAPVAAVGFASFDPTIDDRDPAPVVVERIVEAVTALA